MARLLFFSHGRCSVHDGTVGAEYGIFACTVRSGTDTLDTVMTALYSGLGGLLKLPRLNPFGVQIPGLLPDQLHGKTANLIADPRELESLVGFAVLRGRAE